MEVAKNFAELSHDEQYQVGAVAVRDGHLLAQGWNGMAAGMCNHTRDSKGLTRPEVVHAEANVIAKLAKNGGGSQGSTVYTTHSPCYTCSLLLLQAGVERVVYNEVYEPKAIQFLKERGLHVEHISGSSRSSEGQSRQDKSKKS